MARYYIDIQRPGAPWDVSAQNIGSNGITGLIGEPPDVTILTPIYPNGPTELEQRLKNL